MTAVQPELAQSFHAGGRRRWLALILALFAALYAVAALWAAIRGRDLLAAGTAATSACLAWLHGRMAWHGYRRPVISVSDDEIRYGSTSTSRLESLPIADVAGIAWENPWHLGLRTRSGETVGLALNEISRLDRARVREAIVRRIRPDPPVASSSAAAGT